MVASPPHTERASKEPRRPARTVYIPEETYDVVREIAGTWRRVSPVVVGLVQLALLPYQDLETGVVDIPQLRERLVQMEMERELRRLGATQEV